MADGNEAPNCIWESGRDLSTSRYQTLQQKIEKKEISWRKTLLAQSLFQWHFFAPGIFKHLAVINAPNGNTFLQNISMNWSRKIISYLVKNPSWEPWILALCPVLTNTGIILMGNALGAHIGYTTSNNTLQTSQQKSAENWVVDADGEFLWRMTKSMKMPSWENPKGAVETGRAHQKGVSISLNQR